MATTFQLNTFELLMYIPFSDSRFTSKPPSMVAAAAVAFAICRNMRQPDEVSQKLSERNDSYNTETFHQNPFSSVLDSHSSLRNSDPSSYMHSQLDDLPAGAVALLHNPSQRNLSSKLGVDMSTIFEMLGVITQNDIVSNVLT